MFAPGVGYKVALAAFLPCLAAIVAGSIWLSRGLDELGARFDLSPASLGLITALGADSPEITSALTALFAGENDVGTGVVLGSNLFNLAALMGLGALISSTAPLKRPGLLFSGAVSVLETGFVGLLILRMLPPVWCIGLLGTVFAIYVLMLWAHAPQIESSPLPRAVRKTLAQALAVIHEHVDAAEMDESEPPSHRGWVTALIITGSLVLIIISSVAVLHATLTIAAVWHIPKSLVGTLILAGVTGLPNVYTSARLARRGKGAAVVSETLNSNTINLVVGIGLPALFFGVQQSKGMAVIELWCLIALTAVAILLAAWQKGLSRRTGIVIIVLYLAFVVLRVCWR